MIRRLLQLVLVLAAALLLASCGDDSTADAPADSAPADDTADAPVDVPSDAPADTTVDEQVPVDEPADPNDCDTALTADEIDSIFGTSVEISGSKFCNITFASDAVGILSIFSGSEADEAMDELLPKFLADEAASAAGVVLDDGRGYIDDFGVVVRGDSGRTFSFSVPDNIEVPDFQAALQDVADLLLTR